MADKLTKTLYKSLLRASHKLESLGARPSTELGRFTLACTPAPNRMSSFAEVTRQQFKANMSNHTEAAQLQNLAMRALAQANQRATALVSGDVEDTTSSTTAPARPSDVVYSVGQVFRHKKYGYRAVIVGWDTTCKAGATWISTTGVASLPHGTNQPFYRVLVDVRDRPEAQVSYVAQDNIALLTSVPERKSKTDPLARLIVHPLVTQYFEEYRPTEGYYVPGSDLQASFPTDNPAALHPEAEAAELEVAPVLIPISLLRRSVNAGASARAAGSSDSDSDADGGAITTKS